MWRRYPCCCPACLEMRWEECGAKDLVGELEMVVEPEDTLYTKMGANDSEVVKFEVGFHVCNLFSGLRGVKRRSKSLLIRS